LYKFPNFLTIFGRILKIEYSITRFFFISFFRYNLKIIFYLKFEISKNVDLIYQLKFNFLIYLIDPNNRKLIFSAFTYIIVKNKKFYNIEFA